MQASAFGFFETVLIFLLSLPYGLPPAEEDARLAQVAPRKCVAHLVWNGTTEPQADADNATEQMLANPRVSAFLEAVSTSFASKIQGPFGEAPDNIRPTIEKAVNWLVARRNYATSVSVINFNPATQEFGFSIVANISENKDETEEVIAEFESLLRNEANAPQPNEQNHKGIDFKSIVLPDVNFPAAWTIADDYLIVTIGHGAMQAQLDTWSSKRAPSWLDEAKQATPIEQRGHLLMFSAENFLEPLAAIAPPQFSNFLSTMGFDDVKEVVTTYGLDHGTSLSRILVRHGDSVPDVLQPFVKHKLNLKSVPDDAAILMAATVELSDLFELVIRFTDAMEPGTGQEIVDVLAQEGARFGGNLREGLVDNLGPTAFLYSSPTDNIGPFPGVTIGIEIKDRESLRPIYETVRRGIAANFADQPTYITELEGDYEIDSIKGLANGLPVQPAWCLTDSHLLIALRPSMIKSVLKRGDDFRSKSLADLVDSVAEEQSVSAAAYVDAPPLALLASLAPMGLRQIPSRQGVPSFLNQLPGPQVLSRYLRPTVVTLSEKQDGVEVTVKESIPAMIVIPKAAAGYMLPDVAERAAITRRQVGANNLKQIALAVLNYESANGRMPPAFLKTKDGKPGLSWRVAILPFTGHGKLYERFRHDEPWDSDHNKELLDEMPDFFRAPWSQNEGGNKTNYLTVRHQDSVFRGAESTRMRDITDGTSRTILAFEVGDKHAVPWTKPDDFEWKKDIHPIAGLGSDSSDQFLFARCDGSVSTRPKNIALEAFRAMFTRNGAEPIELEKP